jgi:alpha,alpha-trehalose phosphorylase
VVQSELVANEAMPDGHNDPREAAKVDHPLRAEDHTHGGYGASLIHCTNVSGLQVAAAMDHHIDGPQSLRVSSESSDDLGRVTVTATLAPGERLRVIKFVAYGWSSSRSLPAVRDQVAAALTAATQTGWQGLVDTQQQYLREFWDRADIEVDGDAEVQQAARFALFHILQAGARAEERAIPAKGLTGPGYDGHAFWDTETYVLQVLTYTDPSAACHALTWRHSILPQARARAEQLGLKGAVFPWRTIDGAECSSYWPAGTAAFHIGADIADAAIRYLEATGDEAFARDYGLELLAETARLWRSLGHHDLDGKFRIDGVTGPDEYSAVADNNVYTNLMAQHNLHRAAYLAHRFPEDARRLHISEEETASWRDAAAAMYIPYDERLKVHQQADNFTSHEVWDFDGTTDDEYPLLLHFHYFDLYRKQVVKQADLVLAMQMRPDAFTAEEKARNFAYYEALTVRDSSLSVSSQTVLAVETGHLDLAYDYLGEVARMDLDDLQHNTRDGLHMAALAGVWIALISGFAGMRLRDAVLCFSPRLPADISRLAANLTMHSSRLHVEITTETTTYRLIDGEPLEIRHEGETLHVAADKPVERPTAKAEPTGKRPVQPRGRAPMRRQQP